MKSLRIYTSFYVSFCNFATQVQRFYKDTHEPLVIRLLTGQVKLSQRFQDTKEYD